MRKDFCAFILTHGRPDKVYTYRTLERHGYTGKVYIVIDDEDEAGDEYRRIYGDKVLVFSKDEVARYTDQYDVSPIRLSTVWVRNALWALAERVQCRYFVQLDDDYKYFAHRRRGKGHRNSTTTGEEYHQWTTYQLDAMFMAMVRLIATTPVTTIAMSQGGDHRGDLPKKRFTRKAMNSFVCDTHKPFSFRGRLNEDVNTYVALGAVGNLFFTDMEVQLGQAATQSTSGGMTEAYLASGTYTKSFYSVIAAPSCVSINMMGLRQARLHHRVDWGRAVPLIMSQDVKKAG